MSYSPSSTGIAKLRKLTFIGGPKDGYSREHPEPDLPNPYYFTLNDKQIAYSLFDSDEYEALYEYIPGQWVSYKFQYNITKPPEPMKYQDYKTISEIVRDANK